MRSAGKLSNEVRMLERVLEPEIMDSPHEAEDYDAMDHDGANVAFCRDLMALDPDMSKVVDLGTGTAQIPLLLAERLGELSGGSILGVDLADSMLAIAERHIAARALDGRVRVERRDVKSTGLDAESFSLVISNSVAHHMPDPAELIREMWRLVAPGKMLFCRDLFRPGSEADLRSLVNLHAGVDDVDASELERAERQRDLFEASLRAALTPKEVRAIVLALGLTDATVRVTSDRHWTLVAKRPSDP